MATGKKRGRSDGLPTDYVLDIEKWSWSYSFGLNPIRREPDPYMEFRHLALSGTFLRPLRLKDENAELTIIPSRELDAQNRHESEKPLGVGAFE